ncbi:hypothetical protein H5410_016881 [Solanum commersonii]|uniref:Uncharacterized protein n=1 Tax=Solanum commersonii TaxID=4109 RepID=A0A9J5ZXR0_SOLCO|nr:hypothetical protein H5410_016881 [Solanum commersonii]
MTWCLYPCQIPRWMTARPKRGNYELYTESYSYLFIYLFFFFLTHYEKKFRHDFKVYLQPKHKLCEGLRQQLSHSYI